MADALRELDVQVYSGYLLAEFNDGDNNTDHITSASFTSNFQPAKIECRAMFAFYKRMVDYEAFKGNYNFFAL